MDIDRAVEIATAASHRAANDGPEPPTPSVCVICEKQATPTDCGWVENPRLDGQGEADGPWWAGDDLPEAEETKHVFVCSNRCRSQLMYDKATETERYCLNAVVDACRTLSEYGNRGMGVIDAFLDYHIPERIDFIADGILKAVHDDTNNPPAWLNRDTEGAVLWGVMHRASLRLEWIGYCIDSDAKCKALSAELKTALKLK